MDLRVLAVKENRTNKIDIVEHNRTPQRLKWLVELQIQVLGYSDKDLIVWI